MKSKLPLILTIFTLVLVWWQARHPVWSSHAQVDIWVLWERLNYYLQHQYSFAGLMGNEVLPATLMYVFAPIALIPVGWLSYTTYLPAMMLLNLGVLVWHWVIAEKKQVVVLSLLFLGPILLFRFDALVTLFMLLSLIAFTKERFGQSGWWLGLATGMKVFPIILLPYLCLILFRRKQPRQLLRLLILFGEAMIVPVIIFLLLGGSLEQINNALAFHTQKLISIESLPGSVITGWSILFNGRPPTMLAGNGLWAVAGPDALFNRIWMVPVALTYFFILRREDLLRRFNWNVPVFLIMLFLIFSKNLNPQYLWWFMAMLPFTKPSKLLVVLVLIAALCNQLVFPIFYTTFTQNFYGQNQSYWIYFILLLRNICLVAITYMSGARLAKHEE